MLCKQITLESRENGDLNSRRERNECKQTQTETTTYVASVYKVFSLIQAL